jgi:predicted flap endonuclease-1-like 5' DNA nuclease
MTVWTALILGLLVGWLVEWAIDWIYWRQRVEAGAAELANVRAQNSRLRADIDAGAGSIAKLKADVEAASTALAAANADRDRLRAQAGQGDGSLGQIKAELAAATTELAAAKADNEHLHLDLEAADGAIDQYKSELDVLNTSLSAVQAERDRLRAKLEAPRAERAPADLEVGQGSGNQYQTQLLAVDPALFGAGVHLGGGDTRSEEAGADRLHADPSDANDPSAPLALEDEAPSRANAVGERRRDPLIDINGIGPVYAQRLFDAGIYTFDDLAAQSPARLRELVGAKAWQEADTAAWIAEARRFAQAGQRRSAQ